MKVDNHRIGHEKVIRRKDELVGVSFKLADVSVRTDAHFQGALHGRTNSQDVSTFVLGLVDSFAACRANYHFFALHLVLGQVFHVRGAEIAQSDIERDECRVDIL